jgi:hypothetical protein
MTDAVVSLGERRRGRSRFIDRRYTAAPQASSASNFDTEGQVFIKSANMMTR